MNQKIETRKPAEKSPAMPKIGAGHIQKNVEIACIIADESKMQAREKINTAKVKEYAQLMSEGVKFPPVEVFADGEKFLLADGFHRLQAMVKNGDVTTTIKVFVGGNREALFYSLGANATHGLDRSNADKKKAVHTLLTDKEFSQFSDRDIAKHLGVSNVMVSKYRKQLKKDSGEGTESTKGSRGGRLRAKLDELQEQNVDECISKLKNEIVSVSKLLADYDDDFLRRLFSAEFKLMISDVTLGEKKGRKINPNRKAQK